MKGEDNQEKDLEDEKKYLQPLSPAERNSLLKILPLDIRGPAQAAEKSIEAGDCQVKKLSIFSQTVSLFFISLSSSLNSLSLVFFRRLDPLWCNDL